MVYQALTDREKQVAKLILEGFTHVKIGETLGISPSTVKTHIASIRHKTGERSMAKALGLNIDIDLGDSDLADLILADHIKEEAIAIATLSHILSIRVSTEDIQKLQVLAEKQNSSITTVAGNYLKWALSEAKEVQENEEISNSSKGK